jgi:hypothetical protein
MKIGLYNIEPKIQNTALMQISHYHKGRGDEVEWYEESMFANYDKVYCSSLFTFTNKSNVPKEAICGGTGFDLTTTLPFDCDLDYSLYPYCDCSYLWFSRGCIRKCEFCVVPTKEGKIKSVTPKHLNPNGKYIKIQDNNFFANPEWELAFAFLKTMRLPVDFTGGLDIRIMNEPHYAALNALDHEKRIKIAWDNPKQDLIVAISNLTDHIKGYRLMCYVLIGFNSTIEEDIYRVRILEGFGITPYIMCIDRKDPHQKKFQKWVNGFAFRNVEWEDFKP